MYIAQRLSQYLIMEEDYVGPIALYSISMYVLVFVWGQVLELNNSS